MFPRRRLGMMAPVSKSTSARRDPGSTVAPTVAPAVPPAVRTTARGWRDPRMWIGLAIVAVSVVAGARVLAAADDTVEVWVVASDMGAGDVVTAADLVAERVRFADDSGLDAYVTADEELPADLRLRRGVAAGELLPRSALGPAEGAETVQVPIAVDVEQVPPSVGPGSVVDVYLLAPGGAPGGPAREAEPVLSAVGVVDAPAVETSFGTTGKRQLVLAVSEDQAPRFFALLGAVDAPVLTVVRRG